MANGSQLRDVLSKRHGVLEGLLDKSKTKPELVEGLDQSRSTVDRAIAELLKLNCVEPTEKAGNEFRITLTGKSALQTYQAYCEDSAVLQSNASLLNSLPPTTAISRTFLTEAEIHSSAKTPDIALRPAVELLPEATKLTGIAPVVLGEYFDILTEWIQKDGSELELVLERDLLNSIEENYQSELAALSGSDSVELYVIDEQLPYALWIIDHATRDHAGITVYEDGGIKGSLVADSDQAVQWAKDQYTQYKESSSKQESQ